MMGEILRKYKSRTLALCTPVMLSDSDWKHVNWDAEIRLLYSHDGRDPAEIRIQDSRHRPRKIQFVDKNGQSPFHGEAFVVIEQFELINDCGGTMFIELRDWQFNDDVEKLHRSGVFRLMRGEFVNQSCTCTNDTGEKTFIMHKAKMNLIEPRPCEGLCAEIVE